VILCKNLKFSKSNHFCPNFASILSKKILLENAAASSAHTAQNSTLLGKQSALSHRLNYFKNLKLTNVLFQKIWICYRYRQKSQWSKATQRSTL